MQPCKNKWYFCAGCAQHFRTLVNSAPQGYSGNNYSGKGNGYFGNHNSYSGNSYSGNGNQLQLLQQQLLPQGQRLLQ